MGALLGRSLRLVGLSYGEIRQLIPVPKGTLSYWLRDTQLGPAQVEAIKNRTFRRKGTPRDTQWKRRVELQEITAEARREAVERIQDPFFVAGVVLYWGEGSKTGNELSLANSDPRLARLFIEWVLRYHDANAEFVLKLNLHADNNEEAAKDFWRSETGLPKVPFHKTYIKADGTGHRKNHLAYGVCLVRMRRSSNAWNRTLAWIDALGTQARW